MVTDPTLVTDSTPTPPEHLVEVPRRLAELTRPTSAQAALLDADKLATIGIDDWQRLLELVERRRELRPADPVATVLLGPTGAGKSTVFNLIVEEELSVPGAIRPCTTRPLAVGTTTAVAALREDPFLASRDLDLDWRSRETLPGLLANADHELVLVDTPDFDSVEDENRRRAESLLYRADRIVIVITPEKYGDASVWQLIDEVLPLGAVVGCVLNKFESEGPREDLVRLLAERSLPAPVNVARAKDPSAVALGDDARTALGSLVAPSEDRRAALDRLRVAAEAEERRLRESRIEPWLRTTREGVNEARRRLDAVRASLRADLASRLALEIDSALKRELEARFLEQCQRIDILREPRRWLAAPFLWMKSWVTGDDDAKDEGPESTSEWLTRLYRDRYEEFVYDVTAKLREIAVSARSTTGPALAWHETPNPERDTVEGWLRAVFERLEATIAEESEKITEGLPTSGKVGFYSSQVIFHTLVSVVCIKTGGLFTPAEMAAQGLVSPFVARMVASFVSSSEAAAVETRLAEFFAGCLEEATAPLFEPLDDQIARAEAAVPSATEWSGLLDTWRAGERRR